jgi:ferritin-like metal-binding protein YciE
VAPSLDNQECEMASIESLEEIYASELKDLWSANEQMTKVVKLMSEKARDPKLKQTLERSVTGIQQHTETLKALLTNSDATAEKEYCKGMEGLVKEATRHITQEAPGNRDLLDIEIIAQYQRMSHYGLAGFGTAAAYAKALRRKDDVVKLRQIVANIYKGDEFASTLAERVEAATA